MGMTMPSSTIMSGAASPMHPGMASPNDKHLREQLTMKDTQIRHLQEEMEQIRRQKFEESQMVPYAPVPPVSDFTRPMSPVR
jgi:hypothetical protein